MTPVQLIDAIAAAIARMEGFFKPRSIAQRNHNPGNLRSWGTRPTVGGYAQFDTDEDGWKALRRQVSRNIGRNLTMYEFFGGKPGVYPGYAPAADSNHPREYAEFVARQVGCQPDAVLSTLTKEGNQ
jgi:hypothetical protein